MISILCVDDEPGLLNLTKHFLERSGTCQVDTVVSAHAALILLEKKNYEVIISDYLMPDMNGIEFLRKVRESGNTVPFIIFTGWTREEIIDKALQEGATFYIEKGKELEPQFAEISRRIRTVVQQHRGREVSARNEELYHPLPGSPKAQVSTGKRAGAKSRSHGSSRTQGQVIHPAQEEPGLPVEQCRIWEELSQLVYTSGTTVMSETSARMPDGTVHQYEVLLNPIHDSKGVIIGTSGISRDITERKRAEEALRESEERFRAQYENNPLAILTWQKRDDDFVLIGYNTRALKMSGERIADLVGCTATELSSSRPELSSDLGKAFSERTTSAREIMSEDLFAGTYLSVTTAYIPPNMVLEYIEDITGRKRAEEEIMISNRKLSLLIDGTCLDVQNKIASLAGDIGILKERIREKELIALLEREEATLKDIHQLINKTKDYRKTGIEGLR